MGIQELSAEELDIALACMKATTAYLDDWEAPTRLGFEIADLPQLIAQWPSVDDRDESGIGFLAINNCMNEICHGFEIPDEEWSNWFNVTKASVKDTYFRWLALKGTSGGIR